MRGLFDYITEKFIDESYNIPVGDIGKFKSNFSTLFNRIFDNCKTKNNRLYRVVTSEMSQEKFQNMVKNNIYNLVEEIFRKIGNEEIFVFGDANELDLDIRRAYEEEVKNILDTIHPSTDFSWKVVDNSSRHFIRLLYKDDVVVSFRFGDGSRVSGRDEKLSTAHQETMTTLIINKYWNQGLVDETLSVDDEQYNSFLTRYPSWKTAWIEQYNKLRNSKYLKDWKNVKSFRYGDTTNEISKYVTKVYNIINKMTFRRKDNLDPSDIFIYDEIQAPYIIESLKELSEYNWSKTMTQLTEVKDEFIKFKSKFIELYKSKALIGISLKKDSNLKIKEMNVEIRGVGVEDNITAFNNPVILRTNLDPLLKIKGSDKDLRCIKALTIDIEHDDEKGRREALLMLRPFNTEDRPAMRIEAQHVGAEARIGKAEMNALYRLFMDKKYGLDHSEFNDIANKGTYDPTNPKYVSHLCDMWREIEQNTNKTYKTTFEDLKKLYLEYSRYPKGTKADDSLWIIANQISFMYDIVKSKKQQLLLQDILLITEKIGSMYLPYILTDPV